MLDELKVEVKPGDHVLVVGEPGSGKTLLFRALAGLWPWGGGRICRPSGASIFFLPRRPYLPNGTLRELIAYPQRVENFEPRAFVEALGRVGLSRLVSMLDRGSRWDEEVNWDDQQRLMLARLLIHRPRWLVLDEMLDSIDGETRLRAFEVFSQDLKNSAILHIGRGNAADPSFTRLVRVVKHPGIRSLARREPHEVALPPGMSAAASA